MIIEWMAGNGTGEPWVRVVPTRDVPAWTVSVWEASAILTVRQPGEPTLSAQGSDAACLRVLGRAGVDVETLHTMAQAITRASRCLALSCRGCGGTIDGADAPLCVSCALAKSVLEVAR